MTVEMAMRLRRAPAAIFTREAELEDVARSVGDVIDGFLEGPQPGARGESGYGGYRICRCICSEAATTGPAPARQSSSSSSSSSRGARKILEIICSIRCVSFRCSRYFVNGSRHCRMLCSSICAADSF